MSRYANDGELRKAKLRAARNIGAGRRTGRDYLTIEERREIVRSVIARWEKPGDVAKRIGCNITAVHATLKAFRAGRFTMTDEVQS